MINECIEPVTHSQIKCEEKNSKFILLNPDRVKVDKITVDGCIYPKGKPPKKCDFALNFANITILVEPKGTNLKDAFPQILNVVEDAKFTINPKRYAVIPTTRTPKLDSSIQRMRRDFRKKGIILIYENSPIERSIADFK